MSDNEKKIFMMGIESILAAGKRPIEILRNQRLMNLKLIERSSKCIKDPNPLASTLAGINNKYPLSIDRKRAIKYKIPKEFIPQNSSEKKDMHKHNRILCKKEAVDWWISKSELPNQDTIDVIDILYKQPRDEVNNYYNINWTDARIKWGPPLLERKLVMTREVTIDIPKELREIALKEVMFRDFVLPSASISSSMINKMKLLMDKSINTNVTLVRQIRILLNQMDKRERILPMISGETDCMATMKHAFYHNNYVIVDYILTKSTTKQNFDNPLTNFAKCLIFESRLSKIPLGTIKKIISETLIHSMTIQELLIESRCPDNNYIKWVKAALNIPTNLEYTYGELKLCPIPTRSIFHSITNKKDLATSTVINEETYNFKYGDLKGSFTRLRNHLVMLKTNFTSKRDLIGLLSDLGAFIRWHWEETSSTYEFRAVDEIKKMVRNSPWKIINTDSKTFNSIRLGDIESDKYIGSMIISESTEYVGTGTHHIGLNHSYNMEILGTKQIINVDVQPRSLRPFTEEVVCTHTMMLNHFTFKQTFKNRVSFYLMNYTTMIRKIAKGDFYWKNRYMNKFIEGNLREVSQLCRMLIRQMMEKGSENISMMIILYCLSNKDPIMSKMSFTRIKFKGGLFLDIDADDGILIYKERKNAYYLFGMKMVNDASKLDRSFLMNGLLSGYRIENKVDPTLKLMSLRKLEDNKKDIADGTSFRTYICGKEHTVTRDCVLSYESFRTLNRQMTEMSKLISKRTRGMLYGKRNWLQDEDDDLEESQEEKRRRIEDIADIQGNLGDNIEVYTFSDEEMD